MRWTAPYGSMLRGLSHILTGGGCNRCGCGMISVSVYDVCDAIC
jgi:hypothetical protein